MNKFKLHQFGRPKTVQDQRHRYQQKYHNYAEDDQQQYQNLKNSHHHYQLNSYTSQGFYHDGDRKLKGNHPNSSTNIVSLHIPNQNIQSTPTKSRASQRGRAYSRQSIQLINSKYKQIRSNRYESPQGLYGIQNDRRERKAPVIVGKNCENLMMGFEPAINRIKSAQLTRKKTTKPATPITKQTPIKIKQRQVTSSFGKSDVFIPQKQSDTGMILHQFQPNLKQRRVQDNLYVMASMIRRKMKVLEKKQVIEYVSKLINRDT